MDEAEVEELLAAFTLRRVRKRQFISQPTFVAQHRTYVVEGAFRSYVVDPEGREHTIQFALEDWWISDYNSYTYQQPATMFVVAVEDSTVLQIAYATEQRLKQANHRVETFFRIAAEHTAAYHQRRIVAALTRTAEERYADLLATYPLIVQRLPQYVIASYLGVTTEFISRLRNRQVRPKG